MIKAKISDGSVLLGLSDENLRRLKDGSPIVLDLAEIDMPPLKITIMAGVGEGGSGEEI